MGVRGASPPAGVGRAHGLEPADWGQGRKPAWSKRCAVCVGLACANGGSYSERGDVRIAPPETLYLLHFASFFELFLHGFFDSVQDVLIAGAAAEVTGELLAEFFAGEALP